MTQKAKKGEQNFTQTLCGHTACTQGEHGCQVDMCVLQGMSSGRVKSGKICAPGLRGRKTEASPAASWIDSPSKNEGNHLSGSQKKKTEQSGQSRLSELEPRCDSWSHITYGALSHPTNRPTPRQQPELPKKRADKPAASHEEPDRGWPPEF